MNLKDFDYFGLTPAQRILLAQELWDSVAEETVLETTPEQRAEIERRVALVDAGQMGTSTWPEVKARLLARR